DESTDVYTSQLALDLTGPVDADRLREAARAMLDQHANLRAGFRQTPDGRWLQVVPGPVPMPFRTVDVSSFGAPEDEARAIAEHERAVPFDLRRPPLLRWVLVRLGEDRHRLILTNHHILLDGWSMPVLFTQMFAHYRRAIGVADPVPGIAVPAPYRDYLSWLAGADREAAEAA
ncbi:condensation domain-containing protein, partial [Streptomyces malaysiense]|uniref:condensation domain-containing protein n=1 Tax=Streptomyces malaysiense TaxID=1428626 RepID=UPI001F0A5A0F